MAVGGLRRSEEVVAGHAGCPRGAAAGREAVPRLPALGGVELGGEGDVLLRVVGGVRAMDGVDLEEAALACVAGGVWVNPTIS